MTAVTPQAIPAPDSTADLFLVVYAVVDDLYRDLAPDYVRYRPGHHRMALSDSEVVTLSLMQEALSVDSEHAFVRRVRRDHQALFPGLRDRSRYHRRRKALVDIQQVLFARLAAVLSDGAGWHVLDSAPVETTKVERSQTGRKSIPEAAYHFKSVRHQLFFGLRLHLVITDEGAVAEFALAPANVGERDIAEAMLRRVEPPETGLVLGDAGSRPAEAGGVGEDFRWRVAQTEHDLWAIPKDSTGPPEGVTEAESKAWRRWVRSKRSLVETVLAMLADQFQAETTRARSLLRVQTRMVAKLLAFDLGVYLNRMLGRPSLAIKSLYA